MSLNTAHTPDGRGVLLYYGEVILIYSKEVTLEFDGSDAVFKGKKKGDLYLTSHRIIFTNGNHKDRLLSFSIPFNALRDVKLEQPVFGANYLKGQVLAQPNGNWEGDAIFKMTFYAGGCIEFGEALLNAANLARQHATYNAPPAYAPPGCGYFSAPPSYYSFAGTNYYGMNVPTNVFPDTPAAGTVYMYEAPPPYAGIPPPQTQPPYPIPQQNAAAPPYYSATQQNGAANPKEAEAYGPGQPPQPAAAAAYYNGDPYAAKPPPTYDQVTKR